MRPPRLVDVAAHAKVSEATVSRVLNGKPNVAESTRQAVLTALDVLGYDQPHRLRRAATGLVGLICPALDTPIVPALSQVIVTSLAGRGYTAVLCPRTPGGRHEDACTRMLLDRGVAGIIVIGGQHADTTTSPDRYLRLREGGLPLVLLDGYHPGIDAPVVSTDDAASMDLALTHLIQLGHTEIGLAAGPERQVPVIRRIQAYRETMARLLDRRDPDALVETTTFTVEGGAAAATRLLSRGCTAVVCDSDLMALGAIRAARALGRQVPQDVSVVGHDDSVLMAFTDPPLTTVRQDVASIGETAVRCLLDEIDGRPGPRDELVFRPELVVRASTAPVPTRR
ncbi:LacI family DNA-binding transcriptional regulator [Arsenicicoccus dermatophilus]|uniref:LacI family DNA-binding transcriptional regulator n=1 Tax=Arsenicicoccus dermatophilus TaxID=1076331 RepID=UPI001F4D1863|nr:LacI family DNA-binding transcriptional regulator [Arsenicicoccus dermatophilus]MCH8612001.1 LacI family transcriptional regulator [Arsenicicoccus dermatophilus]